MNQVFEMCANCAMPTKKTIYTAPQVESAPEAAKNIMPKESAKEGGQPRGEEVIEETEEVKAKAQASVVVHFDAGSSKLSAGEKEKLGQVCSREGKPDVRNPGVEQIRIEGRTDSKGSQKYNDWLAAQRASAVAQFMRECRSQKAELLVQSKGKCCYQESNATPAGRAQNRRAIVTRNTLTTMGQVSKGDGDKAKATDETIGATKKARSSEGVGTQPGTQQQE